MASAQARMGAPLNYVVFMPDGRSRDSVGNFNNGVIYLTPADGDIYNSRAITVWGSTGRVRGWDLTKVGSTATWVQQ